MQLTENSTPFCGIRLFQHTQENSSLTHQSRVYDNCRERNTMRTSLIFSVLLSTVVVVGAVPVKRNNGKLWAGAAHQETSRDDADVILLSREAQPEILPA
ncbi:hypothetical protein B0F90DRAFT_1928497 [Multifurca ochricompacta]|uniref:Uncharacterized protein n=1 Tax=Multifurca ochricompacta TaxID=376703 RepID=A0AAD4LWX5_9AGAM|nr:hypothetical protein B0F90DRAFT_1928497 [Multifurca ochricompacta]